MGLQEAEPEGQVLEVAAHPPGGVAPLQKEVFGIRGQGQKGLLGLFNADGFPDNALGGRFGHGGIIHARNVPFAKVGDLRPSRLPTLTPHAWGLRRMTSQARTHFPDPDLPTMRSRKA